MPLYEIAIVELPTKKEIEERGSGPPWLWSKNMSLIGTPYFARVIVTMRVLLIL